jgi:tetratricopeptide (TPR) repeat protein/predicted Ser/Thr protein kinase
MLQPDAHLGIYRLIAPLGAGGMGEVWKAEDTRLGRTVAIKILPAAVAAESEAMARLRREARTAAQLNHPNIATIHAFDEAEGRLYIVMEYAEGESLGSLIRRGPLAEADVCRIGKSVADALAEAHAKGIVHRDIKPDNIVVNGPRVKVLDFGIARRVDGDTPPIGPDDPTAFRTQTGYIVGTPHYMSPEQAMGKTFDHRTDIFSLGVVLYHAATGRLPFYGETITETILKIARDEPEPVSGVSPGLLTIIRKCLQKNPGDRYASAGELAAELDAEMLMAKTAPATGAVRPAGGRGSGGPTAPQTERVSRRRWPWVAGVSTAALVIVLGAIVAARPKPKPAPPPPKPVAITTSSVVEARASAILDVTEPATDTTPKVTTTTAVVIEPVDKPQTAERTAEDFYNEGMVRLVERQPFRAREAFESAVERDPQHARAHFRLGEMALFGRDFPLARKELETALAERERLDPRERKLAELGLALLDRDRERAEELAREIAAISPRDPDLMRFRALIERPADRPFRQRRKP